MSSSKYIWATNRIDILNRYQHTMLKYEIDKWYFVPVMSQTMHVRTPTLKLKQGDNDKKHALVEDARPFMPSYYHYLYLCFGHFISFPRFLIFPCMWEASQTATIKWWHRCVKERNFCVINWAHQAECCSAWWAVELSTKFREIFTIFEKAFLRSSPWCNHLLALSHSRIYATNTLC